MGRHPVLLWSVVAGTAGPFAPYHARPYDAKGVGRPTDSAPGRRRPQAMGEAAGPPDRLAALRRRLAALGAPRGEVSAPAPMLATLSDRPPSGPGWVFEIKYDGVRVLAGRAGPRVELVGRHGRDVTSRYPEVAAALRELPAGHFVLDGELVALDDAGRPSFQRLQARMHLTRPADVARARGSAPVAGVFFDCLALEHCDLRGLPLTARKELLLGLLPARGVVSSVDHVSGPGEAFLAAAGNLGLEGIVAKRAESPYRGGRSRDWVKVKCQLRQEFVIGGYTEPRGSRARFGALHVGLYEGTSLIYVGKVGTGFDATRLDEVWARLEPLCRPVSPFARGTPAAHGHHWVEPRLVCEVRFAEWTADGGIRHPTFLGLRDDKRPEECRREEPEPAAATPPVDPPPVSSGSRPRRGSADARGRGAGVRDGSRTAPARSRERAARARGAARGREARPAARGRDVEITNPDKVFWPAERYTKGDLIAYYEAVAPWLLPYLRDRPIVLTRYPDGIEGKSFFQKDAPVSVPDWVRTERMWSADTRRHIAYFIADDVETLRYVANLATIPLHLWASRVRSLEAPDWLVLDLDPKGAPFGDVVRVARALHRILGDLELPGYVKTSGASGLHVLVPLGARYSYEEAREFARLVATLGVEAEPDVATIVRPVSGREGKVYIDFLQNGRGRTIAAPFSVRPLPGAPVSCPLRWPEVTARLDPGRFTIRTALARFAETGDPMAPVLTGSIDMAAALARMRKHVARR